MEARSTSNDSLWSAVAQKIHYQGGRCLEKGKKSEKKARRRLRGLGEKLHSLNRFKRTRAAPVTPPGKVSLRATVMVKWEDAHEAVVWAEVNSGKHNKFNGKENLAAAAAAAASALQSLRQKPRWAETKINQKSKKIIFYQIVFRLIFDFQKLFFCTQSPLVWLEGARPARTASFEL